MTRPIPSDYAPYYEAYVSAVRASGPVTALCEASGISEPLLETIPADMWNFAYAEGKWTVAEVLRHIIDSERVFQYRALRFARGDAQPLPGFDHDAYVAESRKGSLDPESLFREMKVVRESSVLLFESFSPELLERAGKGNNFRVTVNALAFIIAGHQIHHVSVIREKYLREV